MANHASALKAHRQSLKHRSTIAATEAVCETFLKQFNDGSEAGKTEEAKNSLPELYAAIDKSQQKQAITKNAAAGKNPA